LLTQRHKDAQSIDFKLFMFFVSLCLIVSTYLLSHTTFIYEFTNFKKVV
jgi:hypothetical protein